MYNKKTLSFRLKYTILLLLQRLKPIRYFKNLKIDPTKKYAYIFLAANYGNLGDVAITYAQTKFIQKNTNYQVVEIPINQSLEGLWFVKKHIKSIDLVTIIGGGNMSDIYDDIEYIRQLVIRFFSKNKIVSFPQTFGFSQTVYGNKKLKAAQKVYNRHSNIFLVARDQTSYHLMREYFPQAKVILTPDIVMSLDERLPQQERRNIVVCMRNDNEKNISEQQSKEIIKTLQGLFGKVIYYDTHIHKENLSASDREEELHKIWSCFRSAKLVITDRLHGMIFCYITNTPCIVFQNNNHKIKGSYEWLMKMTNNIILIDVFSQKNFRSALEKALETSNFQLLASEFSTLVHIISNK